MVCHLKFYFRGFLDESGFGFVQFEEFFLCEAERACDQDGGELFDCSVVFGGGVIEEASGGGDFVFDVGEFVHEFLEILVGFQVGVVFGYGEKVHEGAA